MVPTIMIIMKNSAIAIHVTEIGTIILVNFSFKTTWLYPILVFMLAVTLSVVLVTYMYVELSLKLIWNFGLTVIVIIFESSDPAVLFISSG